MPDWIPTTERTPEPGVLVLIYAPPYQVPHWQFPQLLIEYGIKDPPHMDVAFYDAEYQTFIDCATKEHGGRCNATHWQPLPAPPGAE